jgi:hypothetical protein
MAALSKDPSLGEVAYNAYGESVGWVSSFTQQRLPMFEDQDSRIKAAWEAAANAAVDRYETVQQYEGGAGYPFEM